MPRRWHDARPGQANLTGSDRSLRADGASSVLADPGSSVLRRGHRRKRVAGIVAEGDGRQMGGLSAVSQAVARAAYRLVEVRTDIAYHRLRHAGVLVRRHLSNVVTDVGLGHGGEAEKGTPGDPRCVLPSVEPRVRRST
jgi:hypothetical protein